MFGELSSKSRNAIVFISVRSCFLEIFSFVRVRPETSACPWCEACYSSSKALETARSAHRPSVFFSFCEIRSRLIHSFSSEVALTLLVSSCRSDRSDRLTPIETKLCKLVICFGLKRRNWSAQKARVMDLVFTQARAREIFPNPN